MKDLEPELEKTSWWDRTQGFLLEFLGYLISINIGFNSYQESGKLAKPLVNSKNIFEVYFVGDNSYWGGTWLNIPGSKAARFYSLVQKKYIDWRIFSSAVLSRFDLYFDRNYKTADKISVREFLDNCQKNLKQKNKNISLEKNTRGLLLKIGNRSLGYTRQKTL